MVAQRKSVNVRSGRETTITIQPTDKPVTVVITPVVKQGRQWLAIPPGAKIAHKQLTDEPETV